MGGNIIEEEAHIRDHAGSYFSQVFQSAPSTLDDSLFAMDGHSVSVDQNQQLTAIPTAAEIRKVAFSLKKSSSLRPDGFSRDFFTNCWHTVSDDVIQVVAHFCSFGRLLRATNSYFITLIPKKQSPKAFSVFSAN